MTTTEALVCSDNHRHPSSTPSFVLLEMIDHPQKDIDRTVPRHFARVTLLCNLIYLLKMRLRWRWGAGELCVCVVGGRDKSLGKGGALSSAHTSFPRAQTTEGQTASSLSLQARGYQRQAGHNQRQRWGNIIGWTLRRTDKYSVIALVHSSRTPGISGILLFSFSFFFTTSRQGLQDNLSFVFIYRTSFVGQHFSFGVWEKSGNITSILTGIILQNTIFLADGSRRNSAWSWTCLPTFPN